MLNHLPMNNVSECHFLELFGRNYKGHVIIKMWPGGDWYKSCQTEINIVLHPWWVFYLLTLNHLVLQLCYVRRKIEDKRY